MSRKLSLRVSDEDERSIEIMFPDGLSKEELREFWWESILQIREGMGLKIISSEPIKKWRTVGHRFIVKEEE